MEEKETERQKQILQKKDYQFPIPELDVSLLQRH